MKANRTEILNKVIKLLALSNNNNQTEEADSARQMAANLMAKYDISIIEAVEAPEFVTDERILKRIFPIKYDAMLWNIVSGFNGVQYLDQRTHDRGRAIFVGRSVDIEAYDYMIDVILQQRLAAWKVHLKEYKADWGCSPKDTYKINWMKSFALGIGSKLSELTRMKESKIQEYGLVPVSLKAQALAEFEKTNKTKTGRGTRTRLNANGFAAGKNTSIHKGIATQSSTKMLS